MNGFQSPYFVVVSSNIAKVEFKTDFGGTFQGFNATVQGNTMLFNFNSLSMTSHKI